MVKKKQVKQKTFHEPTESRKEKPPRIAYAANYSTSQK
jgi:hypothetical protein